MTFAGRVAFTVPGEPIAKARPRAVSQGGKARVYTPTETVQYERLVHECATAARLEFATRSPEPWPMHAASYFVSANVLTGRRSPDGDNVFKSIADGAIGALFADDKKVAGYFPTPTVDAIPRVEVVVLAFVAPVGGQVQRALVASEQIMILARRLVASEGRTSSLVRIDELAEACRQWGAQPWES